MKEMPLKSCRTQLFLAVLGIGIGCMIGAITMVFGSALLWITEFRGKHIIPLIPCIPIAGLCIVWFYEKFGGRSKEGMNLVLDVAHRNETTIPKRLIPLIMGSTWLTHFVCGSAGREGVAVQIGAAVSNQIGKRFAIEDGTHIFLVTGMAAGFAGLFQTPVAAIFFAAEVLVVGQLALRAIVPMVTAAFSAAWVSHFLGLEKFTVAFHIDFSFMLLLQAFIMGIIFGVVGTYFAKMLRYMKQTCAHIIPNAKLRIFVFGILLAILLFTLHYGRYTGLGTNLISDAFSNQTIYPYDWLCKALLTGFTLAIGFQGGEVTPLFSIGASLGAVLIIFFDVPIAFAAALGYVVVFGSATNTFFAPICIGMEVFGYDKLIYFLTACVAAHIFCHHASIYGKQKHGSYYQTVQNAIKIFQK